MNKKNVMKTNRNQKANNLCELSMDDLDWVTGGELTEEQRAHFIRTLTSDKKNGCDKANARRKYNIPDLLEVIEEVCDTL